jgi:hypothetical protein
MAMKKYALAVLLILLPAAVLAAVPQVTNTATVTATNGFTTTGDGTTTVSTPVLPAPLAIIPTLSSVGLATLAVLLAGFGVVGMRRRTRRPV